MSHKVHKRVIKRDGRTITIYGEPAKKDRRSARFSGHLITTYSRRWPMEYRYLYTKEPK